MHKTTATTTTHTCSVENTMNNRAELGFEKFVENNKTLTATGSLGSMNSTSATPIGDWISPIIVGWKKWKEKKYKYGLEASNNISMEAMK